MLMLIASSADKEKTDKVLRNDTLCAVFGLRENRVTRRVDTLRLSTVLLQETNRQYSK